MKTVSKWLLCCAAIGMAVFAIEINPSICLGANAESEHYNNEGEAGQHPGIYAALQPSPDTLVTRQKDNEQLKVTHVNVGMFRVYDKDRDDAARAAARARGLGETVWSVNGGTVTYYGRSTGWGCAYSVLGVYEIQGSGTVQGGGQIWYSHFHENRDEARIVLEINYPGPDDDDIFYGDTGTLTVGIQGGSSSTSYTVGLDFAPLTGLGSSRTSVAVNGGGGSAGVTLSGQVCGNVTITASTQNAPTATSASIVAHVLPKIDHLEYKRPDGTFHPVPPQGLWVLKGSTVTFKAMPSPDDATWPDGKLPAWTVASDAAGTGVTKDVTFNTVSSSSTSYYTVKAKSGNEVPANILVVELASLNVAGATLTHTADTYTVTQSSNDVVTITAVMNPAVAAASVPTGLVTWTNGTPGSNLLERLVSRATATDTEVTATCGKSLKVRIIVRPLADANATVAPTPNPTINSNSTVGNCQPNPPTLEWDVVSVAGDNYWYVRVTAVNCTGNINIRSWPSLPTTMVVPNTSNPVDGGNINNTIGSLNHWSVAISDMSTYNTVGGGAGPNWHSTAASAAHEMFHWNTDWMVTCLGAAGGNWTATEIDLENLKVSALDQLTATDARAALKDQVDARFAQFCTGTTNCWINTIAPHDKPGCGGGAYAAGQAVLNGLIANVEAFRRAKGW